MNKVILIGHIGGVIKKTDLSNLGKIVSNFSMATTEKYRDLHGNRQEKTEWHKITTFNFLPDFISKGSHILVEGKLVTEKWQDDTGADRYTTKVVARSVQSLDKKGDTSGLSGGQDSEGDWKN